jgi:hypothetical protein
MPCVGAIVPRMVLETNHGPEGRSTRNLTLEEFRSFTLEVLAEMVNNRDVESDEAGRPRASILASGETPECSWIHLVVDMSAIGLPKTSDWLSTPTRVRTRWNGALGRRL